VTATHDNTTTILYVNGVQVAKDINDNSLPLSTGSVYVGNIPTSITIWSLDGAVNNVRLYTQSLTVNDVQQLYAEGLSQHQSLADK
jgi:RNA recognition motif-containing protein